jgi:mitochondrial distribution and morphology protein 31
LPPLTVCGCKASSTTHNSCSLLLSLEFVARQISNYLTKETGWTVIFESAIVPKWKDGQISFKRTYISRHPDLSTTSDLPKPSTSTASGHPAHAVATRFDAHHPTLYNAGEDDIESLVRPPTVQYDQVEDLSPDQRITTFDLEVDSVDVQLSFRRWLDGKGLVQHAVIKGVRGVVGMFVPTPVFVFLSSHYHSRNQIDVLFPSLVTPS